MVRPPPFFLMSLFFFFRHTPKLVGRVAQHAVKNAAAGVFPVGIALIRQPDHILGQFDGTLDISIAGFHLTTLSGWMLRLAIGTSLPALIKTCAKDHCISRAAHEDREFHAHGGFFASRAAGRGCSILASAIHQPSRAPFLVSPCGIKISKYKHKICLVDNSGDMIQICLTAKVDGPLCPGSVQNSMQTQSNQKNSSDQIFRQVPEPALDVIK